MGLDKHFDIETVSNNGINIGYRVRSSHIYGTLQGTPDGWVIGRRIDNIIQFEPTIYMSRYDATKALLGGAQ